MQITGRTENEFSPKGKIRSGKSDGGRREQDRRGARGDTLAKEGDNAAVVGIGIPSGGFVRMAVIVAAGVKVGVELGTDREDRQQQYQRGHRCREQAVREAWRTGVGEQCGHESSGKVRIMTESSSRWRDHFFSSGGMTSRRRSEIVQVSPGGSMRARKSRPGRTRAINSGVAR